MDSFKYLWRILTASEDDWQAVVDNMRQSRKNWMRFSRILGWGGSNDRNSSTFFKAVVQANLLFGLETWVMTPRICRTLRGFQHRMSC